MGINDLTDVIIQTCTYGGAIAMIIALCEWIVSFFVRAITDRLGRGSHV